MRDKIKVGDLVTTYGTYDIPLFDRNIVSSFTHTVTWKGNTTAVIVDKRNKDDHGNVADLVQLLTPDGVGWCYLSEVRYPDP